MKNWLSKLLPGVSKLALGASGAAIGGLCWTYLYQPPVPDKLREVE